MTTTQRNGMAFFMVAVLARLAFHFLTGFVADDAFITFRYSQNLAEGLGFVYNTGEPILGTSTPLFTFILAFAHLVRLSLPVAALFVSVVSSGLTTVLLYRMSLSLRLGWAAPLPAIAYALFPRSLAADSSGMETALFTLLITAAFYFQQRRLVVYAIGMATLAVVTRLEGGILLGILLVYNLYRNTDRPAALLMVPLLLLGPWLLFATLYFGSPIPNSVPAKLALYSHFGTESPLSHLILLMGWHHPLGWILTLAAIPGGIWLSRKQNWGGRELIWLCGMILFFTLSRTKLFSWYVTPIYPVLFLFVGAGVVWLSEWLVTHLGPSEGMRHHRLTNFVGGAVVVVLLVASYPKVSYYREFQTFQEEVHREAGIYLNAMATDDQIVAAEDIGYLGFYSQRTILDRDGLVSPVAVPYNRDGEYLALILDHQPDWVCAFVESPISGYLGDDRFLREYELRQTLHRGRETEYRIFERSGSESMTNPVDPETAANTK